MILDHLGPTITAVIIIGTALYRLATRGQRLRVQAASAKVPPEKTRLTKLAPPASAAVATQAPAVMTNVRRPKRLQGQQRRASMTVEDLGFALAEDAVPKAVDVRALLRDPQTLAATFALSEILAAPIAMRDHLPSMRY